jgi:hypothetical protein
VYWCVSPKSVFGASPFYQMLTNQDEAHHGWPKPSPAAEEWRCENVKRCLEAVQQRLPESDPKFKLKEAFESSITAVVGELPRAFERISSMDEKKFQEMKGLVRNAAELFLELEAQRCRFVVFIPYNTEKPLQGRMITRQRLELVVEPEVKRKGNAQGQNLDREELYPVA